jgi:Ca-activated chloride channel family protein
MKTAQKLPLVKRALQLLGQQLREQDRVAMALYAGAAGLVLPPDLGRAQGRHPGRDRRLEAGGSTPAAPGSGSPTMSRSSITCLNGNNRVILATDGDFNVGASSDAEMERLIEEKRQQGSFLTVLGFGMGNLKDSKMEKLADKGKPGQLRVHANDNRPRSKEGPFGPRDGVARSWPLAKGREAVRSPSIRSAWQRYRLIGYATRDAAHWRTSHDDHEGSQAELAAGHYRDRHLV